MDILVAAEKLIWLGFASLGFAVLFNVPPRTLPLIWILGAVCGGFRLLVIELGFGFIQASFAGATLAGIISIWAAHAKHTPPFIFAIPAVIPMVPGAYAYRMMLGVIRLSGEVKPETYGELLHQTVNNGLNTLFILMSLALGVSLPMLIMRRDTVKEIKLPFSKGKD